MHFFFNVLALNPETALPVVRTRWAQMTTFCTSYEQHHLSCVKNSFINFYTAIFLKAYLKMWIGHTFGDLLE